MKKKAARVSRYELWFNNKLGFTRKPRILHDVTRAKKNTKRNLKKKKGKKSAKTRVGRKRMWKSAASSRPPRERKNCGNPEVGRGKFPIKRPPHNIFGAASLGGADASCRVGSHRVARPNNKAITIDNVVARRHYTHPFLPCAVSTTGSCVNAELQRVPVASLARAASSSVASSRAHALFPTVINIPHAHIWVTIIVR